MKYHEEDYDRVGQEKKWDEEHTGIFSLARKLWSDANTFRARSLVTASTSITWPSHRETLVP